LLGDAGLPRNPLAVVLLADERDHGEAIVQAEQMLRADGSPIPVAGWVADDPASVAALRAGEWTKSLRRGPLVTSVGELAASLTRMWPVMATAGPSAHPPGDSAVVRPGSERNETPARGRPLMRGPGGARLIPGPGEGWGVPTLRPRPDEGAQEGRRA
jgi:hypothetical protein